MGDSQAGRRVIKDQLPAIFHWKGHDSRRVHPEVRLSSTGTANPWRLTIVCCWIAIEIKDAAIKVVGVGSVGTSCAVVLLMAGGEDPLILQVQGGARLSPGRPMRGRASSRTTGSVS